MVFSSLLFTFLFLPLLVVLYYVAENKYRNYILLIASLAFYGYGEPKFIFVMLVSIIINYGLAMGLSHFRELESKRTAKLILMLDIVINISILFVFKYLNFSIRTVNLFAGTSFSLREIALPIGISFFTFQAMSYVIDVYRGTVKAQRNPLLLALYISFFPQLIAGPIVRYSTIANQIENREYSIEKFSNGVKRFLLGFSKKVILANNLSTVADAIWGLDVQSTNPVLFWIGSICFSLHIFYDFSGYSDMAIGLGKMFGFEFEENFNYPYISKSVTEFWRRWHISLGRWFRDYVYIPLGGSRVSWIRHIFNLLIVWTLTGIWHGANYTFIAWGIGYFVLLVIEKYAIKPEERKNIVCKVSWQIVTLLCVNFGWVLFNSTEIAEGGKICLAMLGGYKVTFAIDSTVIYYFREFGIYILLGIVFATPVMKILGEKLKRYSFFEAAVPFGYGVIFLWATSFIILGAHNPFIYFNF